jgi:tetrahydromethanopterin S-methyltransferase subunit D
VSGSQIMGAILSGMGGFAALRLLVLTNCTSCRPRCPNRHQCEIQGLAAMLAIAFMGMTALAAVSLRP